MRSTLRLNATREDHLLEAAALLRDGGTVAFPTETVYGLGANALSEAAVAAIFEAKRRPSWDPLIVHLAQAGELSRIARVRDELAGTVEALSSAFWPGPLTLLLPRLSVVPDAVTAGRPLVGVRVPGHPVARRLLALASVPVAAPSANVFGHTSPTSAAHVLADLDGRIDAVLDGGPSMVGVESTVLDPAAMIVYRPGAVTLDEITRVCGRRAALYMAPERVIPVEALPSPGVGIRHYAPRARVVLAEGSPGAFADEVARLHGPGRLGVLLPTGWLMPQVSAEVFHWGDWQQPATLAAKLFAGLRELDERNVDVIVCPLPEPGGVRDAIRDRLGKAARTH